MKLDDYYDVVVGDMPTRREINQLASRAKLDPRDPDALDDDEHDRLEEARQWEP